MYYHLCVVIRVGKIVRNFWLVPTRKSKPKLFIPNQIKFSTRLFCLKKRKRSFTIDIDVQRNRRAIEIKAF